jgi:hypothetical protein
MKKWGLTDKITKKQDYKTRSIDRLKIEEKNDRQTGYKGT